MTVLEVHGVSKRFGGLLANNNVSMHVEKGEIVGLIGPNGAGKTTLFNMIAGHYKPDAGKIVFMGRDITGLKPHEVCHLGIARTFQLVAVFQGMTVFENILAGTLLRANSMAQAKERAKEIIRMFNLERFADTLVDATTLAVRKRIEIARAIATAPKLLLLDEAMSGLTPKETSEAVNLVRDIIRQFELSVIMVEHVMEVVMPLSDRVVVLNLGEKLCEGKPEEVAQNPEVIRAYLGGTEYEQ